MAARTRVEKPLEGAELEEHTRCMMRMLMEWRGVNGRKLAEVLRVSEQSISDRLRPRWTSEKPQPPFRQTELKAAAVFLRVSVDVFNERVELMVLPDDGPPRPTGYLMYNYGRSVLSSPQTEVHQRIPA